MPSPQPIPRDAWPDRPIYLTGASSPGSRSVARAIGLGLLVQPATRQLLTHVPDYRAYAVDNGCFAARTYVGDTEYLGWLRTITVEPLFAVAPDVVGDAQATLRRSLALLGRIRALGLRAAFVAQDGLEHLRIPWGRFDCLFIGGSTAWKLSPAAAAIAQQARARGKWVHMGRVNSLKRYRIAAEWGCHSVDGTFLAFGPTRNLPRLTRWLVSDTAAA